MENKNKEMSNSLANMGKKFRLKKEHKTRLPWLSPKVRPDMIKIFNLRLAEPYLLKLKFIAENSPESMQQFCIRVLIAAIDRKVRTILEDKRKLKEYGHVIFEDIIY